MRQITLALSSTALATLATAAAAQTTISTSTSSPVATATAAAGAPSDVTIASGVTVSVPSGTAVTVNSNNSVTNNGTITFTGVSDTAGIGASAGLTGTITNAGTITDTETATAVDENADGYVDGPFATGANRYGVHVTGSGSFASAIANSGTITVTGNNSAGIAVDGRLAGSLSNTGTITVMGANGYGIHTGAVTGDVTSSAAVAATGQGAVGIALDGDVGGAVSITSTVATTGFRGGATAYASPVADDLYIGGPAVRIAGSVAGGVSLSSASGLTSYGSAPALLVGSATESITLSPVSGSTYGLVLAGTVTGSGINAGIDGSAITVGGQGGGVTTITGGIGLTSTVAATANQANATALVIGTGASVPTLAMTGGALTATGGVGTYAATALLVQAGGTLSSITSTGTISAVSSGNTGTATAIRDLSGTLTSITNSGTISATLTGSYSASQATAIDLSANTSGVAIVNAPPSTTPTLSPVITGAVLTGSGNDMITVTAGGINGAVSLGGGTNAIAISGTGHVTGAVDLSGGAGTMALSGKGALTGDVTFGAGGEMTLADTATFTGAVIQNGSPFALTVTGGTFAATNTGTVALSSLTVGAGGAFQVNVDPTAGTSTSYVVSGAASLATGATIALNLTHFLPGAQNYTVVSAGSLTGGTGLSVLSTSLPYIYAANVSADASAGTVTLALQPKTAAQLNLNRSGAAAYGAIYTAAQTDSTVESAFLAVSGDAQFQRFYSEQLPEHAGGIFLSTALVSQAISDFETSDTAPRATSGRLGLWVMQTSSLLDKGRGDTQAFHLADYGLGLGVEYGLGGLGTVGLGYDWSYNRVADPANANETTGDRSEIGGYWRGGWAGLRLHASGAWGRVSTTSLRELISPADDSTILETANARWNATTIAFGGGGSYEARLGRLRLRPGASVDYFRLDDDAHDETGGGTAFDLSIAERRSRAVTGTYTMTAGYLLGRSDEVTSRIEVELGDKRKLSGGLADTVSSYADGQTFTLEPDALRYGPLAKLRLAIGSDGFSLLGEVGAQKSQGTVAGSASVGLRVQL